MVLLRTPIALLLLLHVTACTVVHDTPLPPTRSFPDVQVRVTVSGGEPVEGVRVCAIGRYSLETVICVPHMTNYCGPRAAFRILHEERTDADGLVRFDLAEPHNYLIAVDMPPLYRSISPNVTARMLLDDQYRNGEVIE